MNCIIVHGCNSSKESFEKSPPYNHWIPWIKKELNNYNINTITPKMPFPYNPDYLLWKKEFEKLNVNKDSILIGHSCGTVFLLRYLDETNIKINKLILVAPWKRSKREEEREEKYKDRLNDPLYKFKINPLIKNQFNEIVIFTSDNEAQTGKEAVIELKKVFNPKIINLKNHGHYTLKDMKTEKFPELLEEILSTKY
jgi:predicted alpha/beta hydrolase family esterase